jgi:HAD superfamily hydrolase (TIGR01509 family)
MPFDLVVFDCDGVVVDSEPIAHDILIGLLAEHGVILTREQAYGHFLGQTKDEIGKRVRELLRHPLPPDFMHVFEQRLHGALARHVVPMEGVRTLLDSIEAPVCIASNSSRDRLHLCLRVAGLLPYFEPHIFSADDVPRPKPAPDLYLHAAHMMGVEPSRCCVLEDSVSGVRAALTAGMTTFGFARSTSANALVAAGAITVSSLLSLQTLL